MEEKKYGLIRLSKQNKPNNTLKKNIFESDSDEETNVDHKPVVITGGHSGVRRQTQLDISRALNDDPNVFEYDSIYDEMKTKNETNASIGSEEKTKPKPKYINNLLKFSENRKKDNERRVERKIQKERESEGNEFKDKEQFVTNAYKLKLEEMRAEDERERRERQVEELLDVKKQQDLTGFYRHLLNNDMSSQPIDPKQESDETSKEIQSIPKSKTNRQFRRRRSSSEESSESHQKVETSDERVVDQKADNPKVIRDENRSGSEDNESIDENENNSKELQNNSNDNKIEINVENNDSMNEKKTKVDKIDKRELLLKLFTKRTVGEVFSESQMRYFERKNKYII